MAVFEHTADAKPRPAQSRACPHCQSPGRDLRHALTEHRCQPVDGGTAVETFHVYACDSCGGIHEEYDHEASNVEGPTQTEIIKPKPKLRA